MEDIVYKDVVVIGNGPSGIITSFMLAGNRPFYNGLPHPIDFLQYRLDANKKVSILEQNLQELSEGLEGRSANPVSVLYDTLNHPLVDLGNENPSVLMWEREKEYAVDHVVLGKGAPGGAWQKMEGSSLTISLGSWMELPSSHLSHKNQRSVSISVLRQKRATVKNVAKYYQHYVESQQLQDHFIDNANVTSVHKLSTCNKNQGSLWKVNGYINGQGHTKRFAYVTPNVVMATGSSDQSNKLNVKGENLPFVLHSLSELENIINSGKLDSGNLLIVGAGLSAADAVITAHFHGIPIVHVFRRPVNDPQLIFNKLPQNVYPEYHKVHQMMQDCSRYKNYKSFPQYKVDSISSNHVVTFRSCTQGQASWSMQATYVLLLIGMRPDLSFLPNNGLNLGIHSDHPVDCKNNPIDIDLYSHESVHEQGLYAVGPLVGDNFVRFVQGGCLAAVSHISRQTNK